jgi:hypothetical protein
MGKVDYNYRYNNQNIDLYFLLSFYYSESIVISFLNVSQLERQGADLDYSLWTEDTVFFYLYPLVHIDFTVLSERVRRLYTGITNQ